jgi:hypothetical protein
MSTTAKSDEGFSSSALPDLLTTNQTNLVVANEYLDFIEFLQDELGYETVKELKEKFEQQQIVACDKAYEKFKSKK